MRGRGGQCGAGEGALTAAAVPVLKRASPHPSVPRAPRPCRAQSRPAPAVGAVASTRETAPRGGCGLRR